MSVVGFDDVFGADFCHPTLTTLAERTEDAGARAVELLVQQLPQRQVEGPTRVLPTQLVVRDSTGPAPALTWRLARNAETPAGIACRRASDPISVGSRR